MEHTSHFCKFEPNGKTYYWYVDREKYGVVYKNVATFFALHLTYFYGVYQLFRDKLWYSWMFGTFAVPVMC